jgi:hypothetical protein
MTLQFGLLGPLVVWSGGGAIEVKGAKRRGPLAYLLVHAGHPPAVGSDRRRAVVGSPSRGAGSTVQTYLSRRPIARSV